MNDELLVAAAIVASRLARKVQQEIDSEARMIFEVTECGGSMPANYWQERWKAEQKFRLAMQLVEALRDA